jgi:hypothetical protein
MIPGLEDDVTIVLSFVEKTTGLPQVTDKPLYIIFKALNINK